MRRRCRPELVTDRSPLHLRSLTPPDRRIDPPVCSTAAPGRDDGQPTRWIRVHEQDVSPPLLRHSQVAMCGGVAPHPGVVEQPGSTCTCTSIAPTWSRSIIAVLRELDAGLRGQQGA
jgi:hypothetical protein